MSTRPSSGSASSNILSTLMWVGDIGLDVVGRAPIAGNRCYGDTPLFALCAP